MKNRFLKGISTLMMGTALTFSSLSANSSTDALKTKANLNLIDAISLYPLADLEVYYPYISGLFDIAAFEQKFVGNLLISTYSFLPSYPAAPLDAIGGYVTAVIHDVSNGTLKQTGILKITGGTGVEQVAVSPVASSPLFIVSTYSNLLTGGPYGISVYTYNPVTGAINTTPVSTLDLTTLNPYAMNSILTYTAVGNFSRDGKYVFYTLTLDTNKDGTADKQIFGILEVSPDGRTLTNIAQAPTPYNGSFMFGQPDTICYPVKNSRNKTIYKMISAYSGFTPGNLTDPQTTGCLVSYDFDPVAKTITQTGFVPAPAAIQGYDLNKKRDRIIAVTGPASDGVSVLQSPAAPFANNSPNPDQGFRLYSYDETATSNAITFLKGHNFNTAFYNVRWSNDGKFIATTGAPNYSLTGYISPLLGVNLPAGVPVSANSPGQLFVFSYKEAKDEFKLQNIQAVSAYPTTVTWSSDDSLLSVSGQSNPDIKDIQLLQVDK